MPCSKHQYHTRHQSMQISSLVSMQRKPSLKGTSEQTIIVVFIYIENIEKNPEVDLKL